MSRCNVNTVSNCQKFWPTSTHQVQRDAPTSEKKLFQDRGCESGYISPGENQFVCCAPID